MKLETAFRTNVGCKRTVNEDSVSIGQMAPPNLAGPSGVVPEVLSELEGHDGRFRTVFELNITHREKGRKRNFRFESEPPQSLLDSRLLVVADGMGGHKAGEVASMNAMKKMNTAVYAWLSVYPGEPQPALENGYAKAIQKVSEMANKPEHDNMGTTLVSALVHEGKAYVGNIGDSRMYILEGWSPDGKSDAKLTQVTKDHSFVQALIDAGAVTPDEAFSHPQKNIITKTVGKDPKVKPDVKVVDLKENDVLLLCSDGLHDMLRDSEIEETMAKEKSIREMAGRLEGVALSRQAKDNVSMVLARVLE